MMRKRSLVTLPPVLFTKRRRSDSVPKVELFGGSLVKSRTRFGGLALEIFPSTNSAEKLALRWIGDDRFSGPGAPNRCPAPALVPFVSTKTKSAALLFVSFRLPPVGQAPKVVMLPPLPQLSR